MPTIIHTNTHTAIRHKTLRTDTNEFISSLFPRNAPEKWACYAEGSQKIFGTQSVARPHCSHRRCPIQPTAHCTECVGVV